MNDKTSNPSTTTRFSRWLFSWRTIRRTLVAVACFATLTALFYTEENWRGKRAWENCKRELEAKGAVLDWNQFIPPPVPDDQNFFKAPKMTEWFVGRNSTNDFYLRMNDKRFVAISRSIGMSNLITTVASAKEYLTWSDQFEPDFDLMREALKRPYARMEGDYSRPREIPIPNFVTVRAVAQTLAQRTHCFLMLGQPEKALRELTLIHDACRVLEGRPTGKPMTLLAAMINVAVTRLYTDTFADGFHLQAWREAQLVELEKQLSEINLLPFVFSAFEQEPAAVCHNLETMPSSNLAATMFSIYSDPTLRQKLKNPTYLLIRWMPRGWVYQNMANIAMRRKNNPGSFDLSNSIVLPRKVEIVGREIEASGLQRGPYTFMAAIAAPNYAKAVQRLAQNQTHADQTLLACALERYRLAHGQYPDSLDALVPQFIAKLPHDIIGGQPLHYRRTEDGKFLLYSIGWNEKDDGGVVALNKDGKEDQENGDWVWPMPVK